MALHINNADVEAKVRALASATGESMTDAIGAAVEDRLKRLGPRTGRAEVESVDSILDLVRSFKLEPMSPGLPEDEILGYGPDGCCE